MEPLQHHRRVLGDATNRENYLQKLKATTSEADGAVEAQLNHMKDHFAKLKFNFIELEAKQLFHEYVTKQSIADAVPDEAEAAAIKDKKKALKTKKVEFERDITELIDATIAAQQQLEHMCAGYAGELEDLESLEAEHERMAALLAAQTQEIGSAASLTEMQAENDALQRAIASAEAGLGRARPQLEAARTQYADVQGELRGLEDSVAAARTQLSTALNTRAAEDAKMLDYSAWYSASTTALEKLSGVRVAECERERVVLELTVEGLARPAVMVLHMDHSGSLRGAEMPSAAPELKQIADCAVAHNDVPYLVRETRLYLRGVAAARQ